MGKVHVNQQELHGKMGLQVFDVRNWKTITTTIIRFRHRILDNLSFEKIRFAHDVDFSHSSFVNATFIGCIFSYTCNYSFEGCDLENCTFTNLTSTYRPLLKQSKTNLTRQGLCMLSSSSCFLKMIKEKKITFFDVKNLDQAIFDDEQIKSAIKETFGL